MATRSTTPDLVTIAAALRELEEIRETLGTFDEMLSLCLSMGRMIIVDRFGDDDWQGTAPVPHPAEDRAGTTAA